MLKFSSAGRPVLVACLSLTLAEFSTLLTLQIHDVLVLLHEITIQIASQRMSTVCEVCSLRLNGICVCTSAIAAAAACSSPTVGC